MGLPMASNIRRAGFALRVWNRTPSRCEPLIAEGAEAVEEPKTLAAADVVVTMLTDESAVREVLVDGGVIEALRPGSVVLEMSTIGPEAVVKIAAMRDDVHVLDAPVSGSVSVAESAQLFAMVGGALDGYTKASPVLDAMTKGHLLLGPSGAGAAMKLALNAMIAVTNESIAETLALATRFGIDDERVYDVLAGGVLASPFVLYKRGAFLHPETEPVAFTTDLMHKDTKLAAALADNHGVRMPALRAAAAVLEEAAERGLGDADMASVLSVLTTTNQTI